MSVTIVTASMPERAGMLCELIASVQAQTVPPAEHLIAVDWSVRGFIATINRLAALVDTHWLMIQPDDDLLDVDHLETLLAAAGDHDVVYSWCRSEGRGGWVPNGLFDPSVLRAANYIPGGSCLIRTKLWRKLDGYQFHTERNGCEDWDFWLRALDVNAKFCCVPKPTWTYRFHGRNMSLGQLPSHCK